MTAALDKIISVMKILPVRLISKCVGCVQGAKGSRTTMQILWQKNFTLSTQCLNKQAYTLAHVEIKTKGRFRKSLPQAYYHFQSSVIYSIWTIKSTVFNCEDFFFSHLLCKPAGWFLCENLQFNRFNVDIILRLVSHSNRNILKVRNCAFRPNCISYLANGHIYV